MPARTPFYIDVGNSKVVRLQLIATNYNSGLLSELGITAAGAGGEPPTGKTLVGSGRLAAMQNGCFGINLVYIKTGTKTQTAKVLCSPTKADTIFQNGKGQTYAAKNITEVRVPRRRVFQF